MGVCFEWGGDGGGGSRTRPPSFRFQTSVMGMIATVAAVILLQTSPTSADIQGRPVMYIQTPHCVYFGESSKDLFTMGARKYAFSRSERLKHMSLETSGLMEPRSTSIYSEFTNSAKTLRNPEGKCDFKQDFNIGLEGWGVRDGEYDAPQDFQQTLCSDFVDIRVYTVKQAGRVLNGWLHIEIEIDTSNSESHHFQWLYVEVQDEDFNSIGEFVVNNETRHQCSPSKTVLGIVGGEERKEGTTDVTNSMIIPVNKYQSLPCFATAAREPQSSTGVLVSKFTMLHQVTGDFTDFKYSVTKFTNNDEFRPWVYSHHYNRGIYFTWKLSEYWCNRHERFRVMAMVFPNKAHFSKEKDKTETDKQKKLQRKVTDWFHPRWYGAADIILEGNNEKGEPLDLDCSSLAAEYKGGEYRITKDGETWIEKVTPYSLRTDYLNPELIAEDANGQVNAQYTTACQYVETLDKDDKTTPQFGGRCPRTNKPGEKAPSRNTPQLCDKDEFGNSSAFKSIRANVNVNFTSFTEYKNNLITLRLTPPCKSTCDVPKTKEDAEKIKKDFPPKTVELNEQEKKKRMTDFWNTIKQNRKPKRDTAVWTCRKIHGLTCLIIALFLLPVSSFLSRYYKETFMAIRWYGCAPWYWIHVGIAFAAFCIFVSGRRSLYTYYANWGHSTEDPAVTHCALGYFAFATFLILSVTGFNRPVADAPRVIFLALHAFLGFLTYFISLGLIIFSQDIKYSPSGNGCADLDKMDELSSTALITIAWGVIDLLFHSCMTAMQCLLDKRHKIVRRGFGFPFISFLPLEYNRDFRGGMLRKIVLGIYVTIAFIVTCYAINDFSGRERALFEDCDMGNMSCDLNVKGQELGCHAASKHYRKFMFEKYFKNQTE